MTYLFRDKMQPSPSPQFTLYLHSHIIFSADKKGL